MREPTEAIFAIDLYVTSQQFGTLPSGRGVLDEDPDILTAFRIIRNAEQETAKIRSM